jgi:16S rRNA (cytosine1402-N4)-methyltransferase
MDLPEAYKLKNMDSEVDTCFHQPVLVQEVLSFLLENSEGIFIDSTVGGGGHADAITRKLGNRGKLIALDRDQEAVEHSRKRLACYGKRVEVLHAEWKDIPDILDRRGIRSVDGFFTDLGVSSHQLDDPERGFGYLTSGRLDMRMNQSSGPTAEDIVNTASEENLADLFWKYGEERHSRRIARQIVRERQKGPITTNPQLSTIIRTVTPPPLAIKTLSRIWQSLRYVTNNEIEKLQDVLSDIYGWLKPGARVVVISYESLTDRIVKRYFQGRALSPVRGEDDESSSGFRFRILTKRVVRPSDEEMESNERSTAAKLRAAEKVGDREP